MPGRNRMYRGPEIQIELMRTTNKPWQQTSMRNGYLISNAQKRERYDRSIDQKDVSLITLLAGPEEVNHNSQFKHLSEVELRNRHSQSSIQQSGAVNTPNSKYVSMTSSMSETSWGEGANPSITFKFNIWRSDAWKGKHDLTRDPLIALWLAANIFTRPPAERERILSEQTPPDWDRGSEFEWLALGGTRIYNVRESQDGRNWVASVPTRLNIEFWWEALQ